MRPAEGAHVVTLAGRRGVVVQHSRVASDVVRVVWDGAEVHPFHDNAEPINVRDVRVVRLRRVDHESTGECPRCGVGNAYPYSCTGSAGYLDVCKACVAEAHDELVVELFEAGTCT